MPVNWKWLLFMPVKITLFDLNCQNNLSQTSHHISVLAIDVLKVDALEVDQMGWPGNLVKRSNSIERVPQWKKSFM